MKVDIHPDALDSLGEAWFFDMLELLVEFCDNYKGESRENRETIKAFKLVGKYCIYKFDEKFNAIKLKYNFTEESE